MRTTVKKEKEVKKKEEKQELKECFVLWKQKSKNGLDYLTGYVNESKVKLVAYFNSKKKNPNEPDLRVYLSDDNKTEIASLWDNVSEEKGTRYMTGKTNEEEKIVAFYDNEEKENRPYLKCYFK